MAQTKKIVVLDQDKCIGCNTCPLMDPDTFEMDQTVYKAKVKKQPDSITELVTTTIASCPVGAITLKDGPNEG